MKSGAWLYSLDDIRGLARCGHFSGFDEQLSGIYFVVIFEQATFGWARGAGAILVIGSSMARAHEQTGLREPADGTSEVRTIDCEYLIIFSVHVANPAGDIGGITIPRINYRVAIGGEARFSGRKLIETAESNPGFITVLAAASDRREKVTHDRHGKDDSDKTVKENSQVHEKRAPAE
jgi:hypothetical protein